jgi:hypothetical protein
MDAISRLLVSSTTLRKPPMPAPALPLSESFVAIVDRFNGAIRRGDWETMRATLDDNAVIESISAQLELGPDELVAWVAKVTREGAYSVESWQLEQIDDAAVIGTGHARFKVDKQHTTDSAYAWLLTGRNNLIWRLRPFSSRSDALACLERCGHGLGL